MFHLPPNMTKQGWLDGFYGNNLRHAGANEAVNVSGGKDSTACYLMALERGNPFRAVFADTGNESPITYDYIRDLPRLTGGPEIEWVKADFTRDLERKRDTIDTKWRAEGIPDAVCDRAMALMAPTGNPYLDLCLSKGRFPARRAQFCTESLKKTPLDRWAAKLAPAIIWIGVRRGESRNRRLAQRWSKMDGPNCAYQPLIDYSAQDVFAVLKRHGVPPNPLYLQGMGRVGCFPCIHSSKGEIAAIARRYPDAIERIAKWENLVREASKRGESTFFAAEKAPGTPQGAPIGDIVQWATLTGQGGRQFDAFAWLENQQPGGGCQSVYGLCETEDDAPHEVQKDYDNGTFDNG